MSEKHRILKGGHAGLGVGPHSVPQCKEERDKCIPPETGIKTGDYEHEAPSEGL